MVRLICGVQLKHIRAKDVLVMMSLNETMYQLAMAKSVCGYCHASRSEYCHIIIIVLNLEVELSGRLGG